MHKTHYQFRQRKVAHNSCILCTTSQIHISQWIYNTKNLFATFDKGWELPIYTSYTRNTQRAVRYNKAAVLWHLSCLLYLNIRWISIIIIIIIIINEFYLDASLTKLQGHYHGRPNDFFPGVGNEGSERRKSPSRVQGQSPGRARGKPPEAYDISLK